MGRGKVCGAARGGAQLLGPSSQAPGSAAGFGARRQVTSPPGRVVCVCGGGEGVVSDGRPAHCAGGYQSRHPRRRRQAGPTRPAVDRGSESEPGGARARPLASLVSREEEAQTTGSPTRGEGRGRRRRHSRGSRRVCGLRCPGRTWSRHRVQLGLPGAPQRVLLKKARCFGKWVWGSDAWAFRLPLGVLRSELRLSGEA